MTFATFESENVAQGIPGASSAFSAGISDVDPGTNIEQSLTLPWFLDPVWTWIEYRCTIDTYLDAGMALHKPLPQGIPYPASPPPLSSIDTLASADLSATLPTKKTGVNTVSIGGYLDYVQRMATSTYRFVLRGWALRAGYQVPIPRLISVAGVAAIPGEYQFATNELAGNFCGIPLWFGRWELWYYVTMPPRSQQLPPDNLTQHITASETVPGTMKAPASQPDPDSQVSAPGAPLPPLAGFAIQGKKR